MVNKLKNFWDSCDPGLVQIGVSNDNKKILLDRFEKFVIPHLELDGKTVIDYGIGGGYFGNLILNKYDIKKYVGIDISDRSIKNAKENLVGFEDITFFDMVPDSFEGYKADVFFCFACIQHFVSEDYLRDFLKKVNSSGISEIYLQIRCSKTPKFLGNLVGNVYHGCVIPYTYIEKFLSGYDLTSKSEILKGNYQYLNFKEK